MQHPLACQKCGAGLPEPDGSGRAWCVYCRTMHESAERLAEAAARITMTEGEVLALLRQHLGKADSMYLAPGIPPRKEEAMRRVHAGHLPAGEPVLGLYDDALFDACDDGFIVTLRRLVWKNEGEAPRMIEWRDLDPDALFADGTKLLLGAGIVHVADEAVVDAAVDVFHILALSSRPVARAGRRSSGTVQMPSAPPLPLTHSSSRPAEASRPSRSSRPAHPRTLESAIAPTADVPPLSARRNR